MPREGGKQIDEKHGGWQIFAPSNIPFMDEDRTPELLDKEGIHKVVSDFKAAAGRALIDGFKVVEVRCAHGHLLNI